MVVDGVRLSLPEITLCAATSVALDATLRALEESIAQVKFGRVLLLSDRVPDNLPETVEWRRIPPIMSKADYSRFMLRDLGDNIETSHALCVQWDGYVLRGSAWDPEFLEYDYIGAPWPHFADNNVGNGGFSLRSRRLLKATASLPYEDSVPEDVVLARIFRDRLEGNGMRFAHEGLARKFAYERMPATGREFGFHGAFNLVNHVSRHEAVRIIGNLEPQLLTRSERRELLGWAVRNLRFGLARTMISRMISPR